MKGTIEAEGARKVKTDKVKILIVDDNQLNLSALTAALNDSRLELVSAKSGAEALKCLLGDDYALVLLDVQMPDIDGFETARLIRLRKNQEYSDHLHHRNVSREEAEAFKGYSLGAVDYIIKPYSKDVLKSKVSVFVNLYLMREEVKRQAEVILAHEKREHEMKLLDTKRRLEEETFKVKEEHRITQQILEHAPVGIVHIGNDFRIREVNPTIAALSDTDSVSLINENIFRGVSMAAEPSHLQKLLKRARSSSPESFRSTHHSNKQTRKAKQMEIQKLPRMELLRREPVSDTLTWPFGRLKVRTKESSVRSS